MSLDPFVCNFNPAQYIGYTYYLSRNLKYINLLSDGSVVRNTMTGLYNLHSKRIKQKVYLSLFLSASQTLDVEMRWGNRAVWWSGNILDLYSGGACLEAPSAHPLFPALICVIFPNTSKQVPGEWPELAKDASFQTPSNSLLTSFWHSTFQRPRLR
jgi:hypothetical protein